MTATDIAGIASRVAHKITGHRQTTDLTAYTDTRSAIQAAIYETTKRQSDEMAALGKKHEQELKNLQHEYDTDLYSAWAAVVGPFVKDLNPDLRQCWKSGSVCIDTNYFDEYGDAYVVVFPEWIAQETAAAQTAEVLESTDHGVVH